MPTLAWIRIARVIPSSGKPAQGRRADSVGGNRRDPRPEVCPASLHRHPFNPPLVLLYRRFVQVLCSYLACGGWRRWLLSTLSPLLANPPRRRRSLTLGLLGVGVGSRPQPPWQSTHTNIPYSVIRLCRDTLREGWKALSFCSFVTSSGSQPRAGSPGLQGETTLLW